jgi:hypothetical protein
MGPRWRFVVMDNRERSEPGQKTPGEGEYNQSAGWFAVWAFLVPLILVVGLAMTGVLR